MTVRNLLTVSIIYPLALALCIGISRGAGTRLDGLPLRGAQYREQVTARYAIKLAEEHTICEIDGKPRDFPPLPINLECRHECVVEFLDTITEVSEQRVTAFNRHYVTIRDHRALRKESDKGRDVGKGSDTASLLQDLTIGFRWNPSKKVYDVQAVEPSLPPEADAEVRAHEILTSSALGEQTVEESVLDGPHISELFLPHLVPLREVLEKGHHSSPVKQGARDLQLNIPSAWSSLPVGDLLRSVVGAIHVARTPDRQAVDSPLGTRILMGSMSASTDVAPWLRSDLIGELPDGVKSKYVHQADYVDAGSGTWWRENVACGAREVTWEGSLQVVESASLSTTISVPDSAVRSADIRMVTRWTGNVSIKNSRILVQPK